MGEKQCGQKKEWPDENRTKPPALKLSVKCRAMRGKSRHPDAIPKPNFDPALNSLPSSTTQIEK
jgi:hypothetical protein